MKFRYLTILFFVLVTAETLGNILGIGYSIVLAQEPITITELDWG